MRTAFVAALIATLLGCGGAQRSTSDSATAGTVLLGVVALAGIFMVYGLIDCAEKNGGACTIPIGSSQAEPTRPGRDLGGQ